jgi:hypothetical protein
MADNPPFFHRLEKAVSDFIVARIKTFLGLKKVASNVDYGTFMKYISIIDYWIDSESELIYYNIHSLTQSRDELVDLYITNIHKETLTVELKAAL